MGLFLAKEAAVAEIRAQGRKLREVDPRELREIARSLLASDPAIMEKAKLWCAEAHQAELKKRERQRQRRLMLKQCSHSNKFPNTPIAPALMAAKEFANG
jgi:hypothetical protein